MASGIYRWLCTPTGKRYIGRAVDLDKRKREFLNFRRRYSTKGEKITGIDHAREKYPEEKYWDYKILVECDKKYLNLWEKKCIAINQTSILGYNLTKGGTTGTNGYHHTPQTRSIISERQKAFQESVPLEIRVERAKYASSHVDRNNPEYRKNLSRSLMGHVESEETRNKIREGHRRNMKPVAKYDMEGNCLQVYESIHAAARNISKNEGEIESSKVMIQRNLKGKNKTVRGYVFKYA